MYKQFDLLLKEINIEYRTTLVNFANYPLIMFAMAKIMERDSLEQNKVALYLFNSIYSKIKKYIKNYDKILDGNKQMFQTICSYKGCEIMEESKLSIQNEISNEEIKNLIYTIRGKQVMIDSDVAMLYHYPTKRINEAVNRNKQRFPQNFCFQLTDEEYEILRCQNVTLNENMENSSLSLRSQIATLNENTGRGKHRKYLPYVFTEQGIAMLSGLLKNDIAIQVSINIINAFVEMRKFLMRNGQVFERLTNVEYKLLEHDKKFDKVFNQLQQEKNIKQQIFFDGQIYDAYSIIVDIIKKANKKVLIIDNYIDDSVLKLLTKKSKNVEVVILTSNKSNIQN